MGAVDEPHEDAVLHRARQPPRRALTEPVLELVLMLGDVPVETTKCGIEQFAVTTFGDSDVQRPSGDGRHVNVGTSLADERFDRAVYLVLTQEISHGDRAVDDVPRE